MANQELTKRPELAEAIGNEWIHVIDRADLTDGPEGTSKKMEIENYRGSTGVLLDAGNVNTNQVIAWNLYDTWDYVLTGNVVFTEINTPTTGFTKTISIYITGDFTVTLPASWTIKTGLYNGLTDNQIVVEWIKPGKVWANINN
tara:strand:+ start:1079 stop:1510 length:432 start_codon:yes stop_codon:yes gene_type:complete